MCGHIQDRLAFHAPVYEYSEKEWDNRREAPEEFRRGNELKLVEASWS